MESNIETTEKDLVTETPVKEQEKQLEQIEAVSILEKTKKKYKPYSEEVLQKKIGRAHV